MLRDETVVMAVRGAEEELEILNEEWNQRGEYERQKVEDCMKLELRIADQHVMTLIYWGPEIFQEKERAENVCRKCGYDRINITRMVFDRMEDDWICRDCDCVGRVRLLDEVEKEKKNEEEKLAMGVTEDGIERDETRMSMVIEDQKRLEDETEEIQRQGKEWIAFENEMDDEAWLADLGEFVGKQLNWRNDDEIREAMRLREEYWREFREDDERLQSYQEEEEETRAKEQMKRVIAEEWAQGLEKVEREAEMKYYNNGLILQILEGKRVAENGALIDEGLDDQQPEPN